MAIGVLTATSLVPSGTRIFPSVPSSTASTSMVALSVSISAITSPDLTASPSFLSHLARLPRSIVGDSAGIKISVGMNGLSLTAICTVLLRPRCSAVDVGIKLRWIRLGVVGGKFRRLVHDRAHFRVDLLQRLLARPLLRYQPLTHLLDRIVLAADLVDLLLGSILGGIRHRMTAVAVGEHFQDDRAVAGSTPTHRLFSGRLYGSYVHAVHLLAGDVVRLPALGQRGSRRGARDRGAHPVLVVLDDVDHRQLPELRHVEALIDLALIGGAVAEIGERHVVVAAVLVGEGEPGPERNLRAHDAVAAVEALFGGEHVHRAALAARIASTPTGELGHDALGAHAAGQHMAVVAIAG